MKILLRIYGEARPYWGYIAFSAATLLLGTAASLWAPRPIQGMIAVLERTDVTKEDLPEIYHLALLLLAVYAAQALFRFLNSYISHLAAWRFVAAIRTKVYDWRRAGKPGPPRAVAGE